jgi:pimeloyl-ACP methyl ester carboxylesterase
MAQSDHVTFNGLRLSCRKAGRSSEPCLVLLHGWPQTSLAWEGVLDDLGKDHYALAFDLPGIGDSRGVPPSAEKTVLAGVMLSAAERLGGRDIILAGYDVGGMIAFAGARDHSSRIKGAVVMNTVIPGLHPWTRILSDPRIFHFALHNIGGLPETLVQGRERKYFDFFYDVMAADPKKLSGENRAAYARGYSRSEALKAGFDWYRAMSKDAEHNSRPTSFAVPMLYLRGDGGAAASGMEDYIQGLRQAGVGDLTTGTLPHCGEFAPEEAPRELIAALRDFRRSVQSGREIAARP